MWHSVHLSSQTNSRIEWGPCNASFDDCLFLGQELGHPLHPRFSLPFSFSLGSRCNQYQQCWLVLLCIHQPVCTPHCATVGHLKENHAKLSIPPLCSSATVTGLPWRHRSLDDVALNAASSFFGYDPRYIRNPFLSLSIYCWYCVGIDDNSYQKTRALIPIAKQKNRPFFSPFPFS